MEYVHRSLQASPDELVLKLAETLQAAGHRVIRFTHRQVVHEPEFVIRVTRSILGAAPGRMKDRDQSRRRALRVA